MPGTTVPLRSAHENLYKTWRMWRFNPSTGEMLAAKELLCQPDKKRSLPDIHYIIWIYDYRLKTTRIRQRGAAKNNDIDKIQNLSAAVKKVCEELEINRPELSRKIGETASPEALLTLAAEDPDRNSHWSANLDKGMSAGQTAGEAGRVGAPAPPPRG